MYSLGKKQKTHTKLTIGILILMIITMIGLSSMMIQQSKSLIMNETQRYLSELSKQTSSRVDQNIAKNIAQLREVSANLSEIATTDAVGQTIIDSVLKENDFSWIGYVDMNGLLHVKNHKTVSVTKLEIVLDALHKQKSGVSKQLETLYDETGILYAVPFYVQGHIKGAMVAWSNTENLQLLSDTDTFNGVGFSYIISQDGDFIMHSSNPYAVFLKNDFYKSIQDVADIDSGSSLSKMKSDIHNRKSGTIHYMVHQDVRGEPEERTLYYTPLQEGSLYLLSIAPSMIYAKNIQDYTNFSVMINVFIFLVFGILILYILFTNTKFNKEIYRVAYVDPVTNGFTAPRFEKEMQGILDNFQPFAFVSVDIRKFKLINDSFGSRDGDRVLQYVHDCLQSYLKEGEFLARISSDTYNLVLFTTDMAEIRERLEAMTDKVNSYNQSKEQTYYLPLDCGIYIVTDSSIDIVNIRDRANTARKNNKDMISRHMCSCVFYDDYDRVQMLKEKKMENSMQQALENGEFIVYLQPKINLEKSEIVGAEALVRWNSQDGLISPGEFIPFFEKNGFIVKLDLYVFDCVCRLLQDWENRGIAPIPISVNLSRNHLLDPQFLKKYEAIQKTYGIASHLLEFELTETVVFENLELLKNVIAQIHAAGFQCSMDDFGSGYSSLNVLKEIPVDILKLDGAFFDKEGDPRGNDVVETAIELARKLGMKTVAEGVETFTQVEFLRNADCDMVQGYVFSKPLSIENFEVLAFSARKVKTDTNSEYNRTGKTSNE